MKLIFNQLIVEITRRCNMACAHCMRGDAQSIDLATEHIDALLDQTKQIEYLIFTGGEPTLNIEGMRYFLDGCIKRNIKIEYLNLTINGKIATNEMAQLLLDFDDWIAQYSDERYYDGHILLWISKDKYHDAGVAEQAFDFYSDSLRNRKLIKVQLHKYADYIVKNVGRAKYMTNRVAIQSRVDNIKKIEYLNSNMECECYCPYRKHEITPADSNVSRILCCVTVTAKGHITTALEASYVDLDSDTIFPIIGHVTDPIFEKITNYNRRPIHLCIENYSNRNLVDEIHELTVDWLGSLKMPKTTSNDSEKDYEEEYGDIEKRRPDAEPPDGLFTEYCEKHPSYQTIADLHRRLSWLHPNEWETYLRCKNDLKDADPRIREIAFDTIKTCEQLNDARKQEELDDIISYFKTK